MDTSTITEEEIKRELLAVWHAMMDSNDVLGSRLRILEDALVEVKRKLSV